MRTASIIVVGALSASPALAGPPRARVSLEISYTPDAASPWGAGLSLDVVTGTRGTVATPTPPITRGFDPELYVGGGGRLDLSTDKAFQFVLEPIVGTTILQDGQSHFGEFEPLLMVDARPGFALRTHGGPAFTMAASLEGGSHRAKLGARARLGAAVGLVDDPTRDARAPGRVQDLGLSVGPGLVLGGRTYVGVVDGRPLREEGRIIMPDAHIDPCSPLAQEWLEQAREEHAAVAAFLRLAAELELVGAPSDLVRACEAAARDESEHARLCLQRAADHEGRTLHLSGLRTMVRDFAHRQEALETLASESWIDGAINEGLAALEALARSADASFIADRDVHERIAVEELGHAELGARIALWCAEELAAAS